MILSSPHFYKSEIVRSPQSAVRGKRKTVRGPWSVVRCNAAAIALVVFMVCLCWWLYPAISLAQSNIKIEGRVFDHHDGHPVANANVSIINTAYQSESDNAGRFFFENVPVGFYRLTVSSSGYESQKLASVTVLEDVTTRVDVRLKRKTYFVSGSEVVAEREAVRVESAEIIEKSEIEKMQAQNISEVIDNVAGVFVEKSGTGGGIHRVSIRGSAPEHVLVLLDGQKINPSGSGVADLSTIPPDMVEKIEIVKGGQSAVYGADALGGIINIVTIPRKKEPSKFAAGSHWGKWNNEIYSSSFHTTLFDKLNLKVAGNHEYSRNDFEIWVYDDPQKREVLKQQGRNGDSTTTRKNAFRKASNLFAAGNWALGPATELAFSGQLYQAKNGVPGSYGWMTAYQRAWAEDQRRLLRMQLAHRFSSTLLLESSLGFSRFRQHFQNDTISVFDSRYTDDVADLSLMTHLGVHRSNSLRIGTQLQQDRLKHQNLRSPEQSMGKITRVTYGFFFSDQQNFRLPGWSGFDDLTLNTALRWDHSEHLQSFLSPQVGLALSAGQKYRVVFRTNYGKSYRQPSNNALFWKGDVFAEGNPDLLPEKSEHSEGGGEMYLPWFGELSGGLTYFHSQVKDLIEWHRRFDGRYYPVNVSRARIYGHEDFIRWTSHRQLFQVSYNNTVCYAKNKGGDRLEDGKFIPFRPRYVTNLSLGFDWSIFEVLYKVRWVSERFTGPANTKREEPYRLEDLLLGLKAGLSHVDAKLRIEWKNLNDEEYCLIYRHPMPGREWGVDLNVSWQFGKN